VPDILCPACQFDLAMAAWEMWVEETYPALWQKLEPRLKSG